MMLDWNAYQQQLVANIAQIGKISPDIVRGYRELSDAGAKTGNLDAKTRELKRWPLRSLDNVTAASPCTRTQR